MALSILLISVPNLVFALLLQQVFAGKLGWFPVIGWPSDHLWTSGWNYTVLPTLAGCFGYIASYARLLKASMLDVMNQDYILTAESKGLTHREVILHHVLRNSFIPIVTNLPMSVAMCITGSFSLRASSPSRAWACTTSMPWRHRMSPSSWARQSFWQRSTSSWSL